MKLNESTAVPVQHCPYCDHRLDRACGIDEATRPSPGDVTMCIDCALPLVFTDDMSVRKPNIAEQFALDQDLRLSVLQRAIRAAHRAQGRHSQ